MSVLPRVTPRDRLRRALLAAAALTVGASAARAVVVAPHALFLDDRTRTAVVQLYNPSDRAEEVAISLAYGYPVTDSSGRPYVRFLEEPGPAEPSAAGWIRVYPRRVRLPAGGRQTVRLLAEPPEGLPDGEYWARLVVHSGPAEGITGSGRAEDVAVGLRPEMRTVTSVVFRKGALSTGVRIRSLRTEPADDSLLVRVEAERSGEAAYLGTLEIRLRDSAGTPRLEWTRPIAVYRTIHRRASLPVGELPAGEYELELRMVTDRADIPRRYVIPATDVSRRRSIRLP